METKLELTKDEIKFLKNLLVKETDVSPAFKNSLQYKIAQQILKKMGN